MGYPTQSVSMRIKITEVNMAQGVVSGTDTYGKTYQVMMDSHGPIVIVPDIGEIWLISRRGNDWILYQRYERGDEQTPVGSMVNGDRRLEADSTLYLNGKYIVINGTDFQTLLDRIEALEDLVGP